MSAIDYTARGNKAGQSRILMNTAAYRGDSQDPFRNELEAVNHPLKNFPKVEPAFSVDHNVTVLSVSKLRFVGPRVWFKNGEHPHHRGHVFGGRAISIEDTTFDGVGYAFMNAGAALNGGAIDVRANRVICVNWGRQCFGAKKDVEITNSLFRQTGIGWDGRNHNKPATERWAEYAVYSYSCELEERDPKPCKDATIDPAQTVVDYNFRFRNNIVEGLYVGIHVYGSSGRRSDFLIENNVFRGNRDGVLGSHLSSGARWQDVRIQKNIFMDSLRYDVYLYNGENILIQNNKFLQTKPNLDIGIGSAIRSHTQHSQQDLTKVVIKNNYIDSNNRRNYAGIDIYENLSKNERDEIIPYSLTNPPYARIQVSDWTIENNKMVNLGDVKYGAAFSFMHGLDNNVSGFTIACNDVAFGSRAGVSKTAALRFGGENQNSVAVVRDVTFKNNTIRGNGNANVHGVTSDQASRLRSGLISNNAFEDIASASKYTFARDNVTIQDGTPSGCAPAGISDGVTPGLEDGTTPPANTAPTVTAGSDQTITRDQSVVLSGVVTDDGLPTSPGRVTVSWRKMSGPGAVTFTTPSAAQTNATFSQAGTYVLELTATDGVLQSADQVTVTVNEPTPGPQPNISISKQADRSRVSTGENITYTLTVRNTGQAKATNVKIADPLPQRTSLVSASANGQLQQGSIVWRLNQLQPNETVTFTLAVRVE